MEETILQVVEAIKTLNLNIDSQSAVEIVQEIRPLLWGFLIKDVIADVLFTVSVLTIVYIIYRMFNKGYCD